MAEVTAVDDPADPRLADYAGLRRAEPRPHLVAEGPMVVRRLLASPYRVRSLLVTERGRRALAGDLATVRAPAGVDGPRPGTVAPGPRRALMAGAEGPGLSRAALAAADRRVRVPMAPGVDSVNVATAAAVALHRLAPLR